MNIFKIDSLKSKMIAVFPILMMGNLAFGHPGNLKFSGQCKTELNGNAGIIKKFDLELNQTNYKSAFLEFNQDSDCDTEYTVRAYAERYTDYRQHHVAFELRSKDIQLNAAWIDDVKPGMKVTFRQSLPNKASILCHGEVN